jgi:hypothetical protein
MLIIALLVLIFLGFLHSITNESSSSTTTTSKSVVVKKPQYYPRYGYGISPPHYNSYKAQYYY